MLMYLSYRTDFFKARKIYEKLGQFDYAGESYTEDFEVVVGSGSNGQYYYIGQLKFGTQLGDGIGIIVWESGDTL